MNRYSMWWLSIFLLLPSINAIAVTDDELQNLEQNIRETIAAIEPQDNALIDTYLCSNLLVNNHLYKKQSLGMITDAEDIEMNNNVKASYRQSTITLIQAWFSKDNQLVSVDLTNIKDNQDSSQNIVTIENGVEISNSIEAIGVAKLRLSNDIQLKEIMVLKVSGQWCLQWCAIPQEN